MTFNLHFHTFYYLAVTVLIVALTTNISLASSPRSSSLKDNNCKGQVNTHQFWEGEPAFIRNVTNAKLYLAGNDVRNMLRVAHVYGTPYEMGYAHGEIFRSDIQTLYPQFFGYLYNQIAPYLKYLPKDIQEIIEKDGAAAALDFTYELTKPYISQHYIDEMQGLADGAQVDHKLVIRVCMFPELIKAACSMMGSWGPATQNTSIPGSLYQLRALDWGTDSPLTNYSALIVYHPTDGNGHDFAVLGWTGFVGAITGYSHIMGVSEKVWAGYNETSSRAGIPFHFLLRDIVQYDRSLTDALNRMVNAERTCAIFVGIGAQHDGQFRAVEYSHPSVYAFDDVNYPTNAVHPLMEGLVFVDKHVQPSSDPCMGSLISSLYGSLDAETILRQIIAPFQTGDLHASAYDFGNNVLFAGVAGQFLDSNSTGVQPAYDRPFFKFNMSNLLNEKL